MPATTPSGWPYVLPADHPLEGPIQSQTLANKLETALGAESNGALTQQAGWTLAAGSLVVRRNGWVWVYGVVTKPGGAGSNGEAVAGLPTFAVPTVNRWGGGTGGVASGGGLKTYTVDVRTGGTINLRGASFPAQNEGLTLMFVYPI